MLCGCLLNSSLCFSVCPLHGLQLIAGEPANVGSLQQQSLSGHIYLLQHRVLHRLLWHGSLQVNICSTVPPALLLFLYLLFSGLTLSPPIPTPHSAAFTTLHCFYNSLLFLKDVFIELQSALLISSAVLQEASCSAWHSGRTWPFLTETPSAAPMYQSLATSTQ